MNNDFPFHTNNWKKLCWISSMSWSKASRFAPVTVESLPLPPSDGEYRSCVSASWIKRDEQNWDQKHEFSEHNRYYLKAHFLVQFLCRSIISMHMHKYLFYTYSMKIEFIMVAIPFHFILYASSNIWRVNSCFILPIDLADSTAKCNILLAIPWRRTDLATHKFAT